MDRQLIWFSPQVVHCIFAAMIVVFGHGTPQTFAADLLGGARLPSLDDETIKSVSENEALEVLSHEFVDQSLRVTGFSWTRINTDASVAKLPFLTKLSAVKLVELEGSAITDDALIVLQAMPRLNFVSIKGNQISGRVLTFLPKSVTELSFRNIQPNAKELAALMQFKALRSLQIVSSQLDDAELAAIADVKSLEKLTLYRNLITDESATELASLENLTGLGLSYNKLTDKSIPHLAELTNLTHLSLTGNEITDSAILSFSSMKSLARLELKQTGITREGTARLRELLPQCRISTPYTK